MNPIKYRRRVSLCQGTHHTCNVPLSFSISSCTLANKLHFFWTIIYHHPSVSSYFLHKYIVVELEGLLAQTNLFYRNFFIKRNEALLKEANSDRLPQKVTWISWRWCGGIASQVWGSDHGDGVLATCMHHSQKRTLLETCYLQGVEKVCYCKQLECWRWTYSSQGGRWWRIRFIALQGWS